MALDSTRLASLRGVDKGYTGLLHQQTVWRQQCFLQQTIWGPMNKKSMERRRMEPIIRAGDIAVRVVVASDGRYGDKAELSGSWPPTLNVLASDSPQAVSRVEAVSASSTNVREKNAVLSQIDDPTEDIREVFTILEPPTSFPKMGSYETEEMRNWIKMIREMFRSLKDGDLSVSAYDTAWVALVPALDGSGRPQFPKCLQWITDNQLSDGSWGNKQVFLASERVFNTLACVVALKTWNTGYANIERGLEFLRTTMADLEPRQGDHLLPSGFEIIFPAMLENAQVLRLDLPYESPSAKHLKQEREIIWNRIAYDDSEQEYPMNILHSLEGFRELVDWDKIMKVQAENGSFFFSPASTACALMHTGDLKCLDYLNTVLQRFNNAVPTVYPIDLLERLYIVDRIKRLGISRYFQPEIKESLDYVYRNWTDNGIAWMRESSIPNLDATAMGFRLLRLNGYVVSPDVFNQFKMDGEFYCNTKSQRSQTVSGMYELFRASQKLFPGETILEEARNFTKRFLEEEYRKNETYDRRYLIKDLHGEVGHALKYPWYASLQRLEIRQYLDQYGVNDVWMGKSLYRMPHVNNATLLNLAKADFNLCQAMHQRELQQISRWNKQCEFGKLDFARQKAVETYFSAAATMFEPELVTARLVWTQGCVLTTVLDDFYDVGGSLKELQKFLQALKSWEPAVVKDCSEQARIAFMGLYNSVNAISQEAFIAQGRDVSSHIKNTWVEWITSTMKEAEWTASGYIPTLEEYMDVAAISIALQPIVLPSLYFVGSKLSDEITSHPDYYNVMNLVNICGRLLNDIQGFKRESSQGKCSSVVLYLRENPGATEEEAINYLKNVIDENMKKLMLEVMRPTAVPNACKQLHLNMAKILNLFYISTDGFSSLTEMAGHVDRVLFTPVL